MKDEAQAIYGAVIPPPARTQCDAHKVGEENRAAMTSMSIVGTHG